MIGSWDIWHEGWKAVTTYPTISGWGHFNEDTWELYHAESDRAEVHNLAADHPKKLREPVNLWFAEAGANGAFPLDDRSAVEIFVTPRPQLTKPQNQYRYYPGAAAVPGVQAVNLRKRSFTIGALVYLSTPGTQGVLIAEGSRFGRFALSIKNNRLHYADNFVGFDEQQVVAQRELPVGKNLILSANFIKDGMVTPGTATGLPLSYVGNEKVGKSGSNRSPAILASEHACGWSVRRMAMGGSGDTRRPHQGERRLWGQFSYHGLLFCHALSHVLQPCSHLSSLVPISFSSTSGILSFF